MDQDSKVRSILIVEDDKDYREILVEALKESGFSIQLAENGQVALDILKNNDFDLILLDLVMPRMDGKTFLYHLENTLRKDIPVIVLTNLMETQYPSSVIDSVVKADTSLKELVNKVKQSFHNNKEYLTQTPLKL